MTVVNNKLIETISTLNQKGGLVSGKDINPKNMDSKMFGPFAVQTYADGVF